MAEEEVKPVEAQPTSKAAHGETMMQEVPTPSPNIKKWEVWTRLALSLAVGLIPQIISDPVLSQELGGITVRVLALIASGAAIISNFLSGTFPSFKQQQDAHAERGTRDSIAKKENG